MHGKGDSSVIFHTLLIMPVSVTSHSALFRSVALFMAQHWGFAAIQKLRNA